MYLNFKIHSFESGKSLNGWIIPHSWFLKKGIIFDRNYKIIFNAKNKDQISHKFSFWAFVRQKFLHKNHSNVI